VSRLRRYTLGMRSNKRWPTRFLKILAALLAVIIIGMISVRLYYNHNLRPVSKSDETQTLVVERGATVNEIADRLKQKKLIRSSLVFQLYIRSKETNNPLIAGTYRLQPKLSTPEIVAILSRGKVATDLVTILPGQRLDQVQESLVNYGFDKDQVQSALNPDLYKNNPALVDKPVGASLEGYLYPESFEKNASTTPQDIVEASLNLMNQKLTPDIRAAYAQHGLSVYQGITLASMVEQEAFRKADRDQIAQVFLSRLSIGMALESDTTARYGAIKDGQTGASLTYDSPYNTYRNKGLPPSPISNVSETSLRAVAYPANTDWTYFVAGDDGTVHFSHTLEEHEQLTKQYCTKLCGN
jgi:UPF0755 protein